MTRRAEISSFLWVGVALEQPPMRVDEIFEAFRYSYQPETGRDRLFGLRVKLRHLRRGKVPETQKHEALTPAVAEQIRSICAVDIQIYDWARDRFGRRG